MKPAVFVADLTHSAQGLSAATFPLGAGFVVAHAKERFGAAIDFRLFKLPAHLDAALRERAPAALCFSAYSWNAELALAFAARAKERHPGLAVVLGGPNFPTDPVERRRWLAERPAVDFFVELEGERGFEALVAALDGCGWDAERLKRAGASIPGTSFLCEGRVVAGAAERIRDLGALPSPYLTGVLDPFFEMPLVPMIETTRGCPFACTFCADGLTAKNKVFRFEAARVEEELEYVARRLRGIDELIITDLNFAMYEDDVETARAIMRVKARHRWPTIVSASAGKNRPERTIEVARILEGAWTLGASIQSTDREVLAAIKRTNISGAAYKRLVEYGNSLPNGKTHSEIILGLPGDTKQKHLESLRFGVENEVNSMRMFQAILLVGTEMASPADRERHALATRVRTNPGCVGMYDLLGRATPVAELEEIIVGTRDMPFADYVDCRVMNLVVETCYNNALFEELYGALRAMGVPVFDVLVRVKEDERRWSPRVRAIVDGFVAQTTDDLFETLDEARRRVLAPGVVEDYAAGKLGINELLVHKALLFQAYDDTSALVFDAARGVLAERGLLDDDVAAYLADLEVFCAHRKRDAITRTDAVITAELHYDFGAIRDAGWRVDPRTVVRRPAPTTFVFFHDDEQRQHVANQLKVYMETPIGLGRMIQRSNLKLVYRSFVEQAAASRTGAA